MPRRRCSSHTTRISIRVASEEDLDQILSRLEVEYDDEESAAGGFWGNRNRVSCHRPPKGAARSRCASIR